MGSLQVLKITLITRKFNQKNYWIIGKYLASSSTVNKRDWLEKESRSIKAQREAKTQLLNMRSKSKQEEEIRNREQEEILRRELLNRQLEAPADKVGEDYFKDTKRFNTKNDERDPIYEGLDKSKDQGKHFKEFIREGISETKETLEKIKHSQPFTFVQASNKNGQFGYTSVSVSGGIVFGILALALFLIYDEMKFYYGVKREGMKKYSQVQEK